MKSCFAHNYTIPFETFFQNKKGQTNSIEIRIEDHIEIRGEGIHKAIDFPGGPVLEVFEADESFILQYAKFRARLLKTRIDISGPLSDIGRITQVLERVIFPIHLQLHFPNLIPLHGGAIKLGNLVYIFLGESGAGKSTTVLELMKRGATIISDDLVFIDTNTMHILPGLPTLRLLQPADFMVKKIERVGPNIEKWWHLVEQDQLQEPLPIHRIFILKPGDDLFHERPTKGFSKAAELLSQTFGFTNAGETREKARFNRVGELAKSVPIEYLHFQKGKQHPIHIDKLASYLSSL